MNFTITTLAESLAAYLAPYLPGTTFYQDPNQQGTQTPAMFLQMRYSFLEKQTSGYWLRKLGLDLTRLEDYNLPDLQQRYQSAAETLDIVMETFPYSDGTTEGTALIRTYDRESKIDLDGMHYKFEIRERVSLPETFTPMQTMDLNEAIKDAENQT